MLQIGEIALIKADAPFNFFHLLCITKEQQSITEIVIIMDTSTI